jgi:hypothetical protein
MGVGRASSASCTQGTENRARDARGTEQEAPARRTLGELGRGRELGHDAVELRLGVSAGEGEDTQELQSRDRAGAERWESRSAVLLKGSWAVP